MVEIEGRKERKNPGRVFRDPSGALIEHKGIQKLYRDLMILQHGAVDEGKKLVTVFDPANPLDGTEISPGQQNPICRKCGLDEHKAINPYLPYEGSENPLITIVADSVTVKEDNEAVIGTEGTSGYFRKFIEAYAEKTGVPVDRIRFVPLTRCAHRVRGKTVNFRNKGDWCKHFLVQDLRQHPPKMIMPIGTAALGALCHKSNALDWGGRLLTWRGWPDDWLTNPEYVKPRPHPSRPGETIIGHPVFGPPPTREHRTLLYPVQSPNLVLRFMNDSLKQAWWKEIEEGIVLARDGVEPLNYDLPHYRLLETPEEIAVYLEYIIDHPGLLLCYDTETTGLYPWLKQRIVFMMFRFKDPEDGQPVAIGFPWDYATSPLLPHLEYLKPLVLQALSGSTLLGHNLPFDVLFTALTLNEPDEYPVIDQSGQINPRWRLAQARLNALCEAMKHDTWHKAYCYRQQRGSLGLEVITYEYAPMLAGYEEEMTLLIELEAATMHPDNGGHYANCPKDKWESHLKPYVLGDVEACYQCNDAIQAKLDSARQYKIPLAHTTQRGYFRWFTPPNRAFVYEKIMSPASSVLTKMMGRGIFVDVNALDDLERDMPKELRVIRDKIRNVSQAVFDWCEAQERADINANSPDKKWELDLDRKADLRGILFDTLNLPIQRLTKTGRKLYGEEPDEWQPKMREALKARFRNLGPSEIEESVAKEMLEYAAMDKFTLNKLSVDHEEVRPLQEYRKLHKLYSTYVRPLRNVRKIGIDKKERTQVPHLAPDGMIHAQLLLTGTRGGRLSSRNPNMQQLPKKGYKHLNVKRLYISRFRDLGCLYGADFSQIELRLMAAACGDEGMVQAYIDGVDLHTLTTSRIFDTPYDHFSKDHMKFLEEHGQKDVAKDLRLKRDIGKTTNFLTGYGGGAFGLQNTLANQQIYKDLEFCEDIIERFFASYPTLREFLQYYKRFILDKHVAVSIFGRVRVFEEVLGDDDEARSKALRAGCNHLIQSTASDMMLVGLVVIESLMREENLESQLVLTVHDSLVIDALRSELPKIHEIVNYVLNNLPEVLQAYFGPDYDSSWMTVPFAGDSDVGLNYNAMVGVPKDDDIDWDKLLAESGS